MTKFFAEAVAAVSQLPDKQQDEIARLMLHMIEADGDAEEIDPAHLPGILEALDQIKRGEFATDEEIEEAFRQFDQ